MAESEGNEGEGRAPEPESQTVELAEGLRKGGDIVDSSMPTGTPAVPHLDAAPADPPAADPPPAGSPAPSTPSNGGDAGTDQ
jgi:hypothetical protein